MKSKYFVLLLCSAMVFLLGCGDITPKGELALRSEKVDSFSQMYLEGNYRVFYVLGKENAVEVETYQNIADNLSWNVRNHTLEIKEKRKVAGNDFYNVTIYSSRPIEKIHLKDQVELTLSSAIQSPSLRLELEGNSKFIGAVSSERLELEMKGLSRANLTGKSRYAELKIRDTAHIIAPYHRIEVLDLDAQNGSYTEVFAVDTLKGRLQNTAKLLYYNSPVSRLKSEPSVRIENKKLD